MGSVGRAEAVEHAAPGHADPRLRSAVEHDHFHAPPVSVDHSPKARARDEHFPWRAARQQSAALDDTRRMVEPQIVSVRRHGQAETFPLGLAAVQPAAVGRLELIPLYGTADGDEPDLARLRRAASKVAAAYHADRYDDLAAIIPALVRSAGYHVNAYDQGDRHLAAVRARADVLIDQEHATVDYRTFGPVTVSLKRAENAVIGGAPDQTIAVADQLPGDLHQTMPEEFQRHRLDYALALVRTGNPDRATDVLDELRQRSPHWLRYQQYARDAVREILKTRPRMPSERQRKLAEFMNVTG